MCTCICQGVKRSEGKGRPSRSASSAMEAEESGEESGEEGLTDMVLFPMEETVQALVDYLVCPLLPFKVSVHESPPLSKQESVAKQMHAVVLLYNYYHRKRFPDLEFLCFEDLCKLAVNFRPSLFAHMKFMQRCNDQSGELDTQLSITEEMVLSACDICKELDALDASGDASSVESWPVSKVAVFLVDLMIENCLLRFGSKTQGVWSPIEKDLDSPHCNMVKGDSQMEGVNRKRRTATHASRNELSEGEAALLQIAFTAVKEETGIDETDLTILEIHIAYSLSKKKSISRFYLMQCTEALDGVHGEVIQVPIKDAIGSLRSPLVSKRFGTYEVTAAVEYFHLMPYADIISDWLSRESSGISSQHLPVALENLVENWSPKADKPHTEEGGESGEPWTRQTTEGQDNETCRSKSGTLSKKANNNIPLGAVYSPQVMTDDSSFNHSGQPWQDAINHVQNTNPDAYVERENKSLHQEAPKALENDVNEQDAINNVQNTNPDAYVERKNKSLTQEDPKALENDVNEQDAINSVQKKNPDGYAERKNKSLTQEDPNALENDVNEQDAISNVQNTNPLQNTNPDVYVERENKSLTQEDPKALENDFKEQDAINNVQNTNPDAYVESKNKSLTQEDPKALENDFKEQAKIDSAKPCHAEETGVMHQVKNDNIVLLGDVALVSPPNNCQNLVKLGVFLASKGNDLLKSSLRALQIKRDELCHQHRQLEDEIALCEKNIEAVVSGREDDITLKIESVIHACNAACSKGGARSQTGECLPQSCKRRRLSDAILILRNPCQELDNICTVNNWILPRYSVQPSDGGFLAKVTVKGLDFEFSDGGDLQSNPSEARESAAAQMLIKLCSMAKHSSNSTFKL